MQPRISVVIPAYNMDSTVEKSVRSVLNQTYTDFELILIDDGSTDQTPQILDRLAAEDARIRVIHQENKGLSEARNIGVANARGAYLSWLDADDWMEKDALEKLINAIDATGAEIAHCNYVNIDPDGKRIRRYPQTENAVITGREALNMVLDRTLTQSLCFNLVRTDLYYCFKFPTGKHFEDVYSSYRLYEQAKKVAIVYDSELFDRLVRPESISHIKRIAQRVASCTAYLDRQEDLNQRIPELEPVFVRANCASLLLNLRAAVFRDTKEAFRANRDGIQRICRYFRLHKEMACKGANLPFRLEYHFLTCGTRLGFLLSRVISLPRKNGTWLR